MFLKWENSLTHSLNKHIFYTKGKEVEKKMKIQNEKIFSTTKRALMFTYFYNFLDENKSNVLIGWYSGSHCL